MGCMFFVLVDGFVMPTFGVLMARVIAYLLQYSLSPDYYRN
jgi:hypothetical protein